MSSKCLKKDRAHPTVIKTCISKIKKNFERNILLMRHICNYFICIYGNMCTKYDEHNTIHTISTLRLLSA